MFKNSVLAWNRGPSDAGAEQKRGAGVRPSGALCARLALAGKPSRAHKGATAKKEGGGSPVFLSCWQLLFSTDLGGNKKYAALFHREHCGASFQGLAGCGPGAAAKAPWPPGPLPGAVAAAVSPVWTLNLAPLASGAPGGVTVSSQSVHSTYRGRSKLLVLRGFARFLRSPGWWQPARGLQWETMEAGRQGSRAFRGNWVFPRRVVPSPPLFLCFLLCGTCVRQVGPF